MHFSLVDSLHALHARGAAAPERAEVRHSCNVQVPADQPGTVDSFVRPRSRADSSQCSGVGGTCRESRQGWRRVPLARPEEHYFGEQVLDLGVDDGAATEFAWHDCRKRVIDEQECTLDPLGRWGYGEVGRDGGRGVYVRLQESEL